MRVECLVLCDSVTVRAGLLYVLGGGLDITTHPRYPATTQLELAVRVIFEREELEDRHIFRVRIIGPDDVVLEDGTMVARREDPVPPGAARAAINLPVGIGVELPREGMYRIEVSVDDAVLAALPLEARIAEGTDSESNAATS